MTELKTLKVSCCVVGCGRHGRIAPPDDEWICADHWKLVDRELKQHYRRVRRKMNQFGRFQSLERLSHKLWVQLREQAIERAMGL